MVREGQYVMYGEKLGELGLFRCKRRYGGILMLSAMGRHGEDGARFFLEMHCSRDNRREVGWEQFGKLQYGEKLLYAYKGCQRLK